MGFPTSFHVEASVQAGRYDKWEVRKTLEEEIKSVALPCYCSGIWMRSHKIRGQNLMDFGLFPSTKLTKWSSPSLESHKHLIARHRW